MGAMGKYAGTPLWWRRFGLRRGFENGFPPVRSAGCERSGKRVLAEEGVSAVGRVKDWVEGDVLEDEGADDDESWK